MKSKVRFNFLLALITTILFVLGIPLIIFSAIDLQGIKVITLIFGIIFVAFGFYLTPIFWIVYGNTKKLSILHDIIIIDKVYEIDLIVDIYEKPKDQTINDINKLISNRIIKNHYIYDNTRIVLVKPSEIEAIDALDISNNYKIVKCVSCGSTNKIQTKSGKCKYCGNPLE